MFTRCNKSSIACFRRGHWVSELGYIEKTLSNAQDKDVKVNEGAIDAKKQANDSTGQCFAGVGKDREKEEEVVAAERGVDVEEDENDCC